MGAISAAKLSNGTRQILLRLGMSVMLPILCAAPPSAQPSITETFLACSAMNDNVARLECFDAVARDLQKSDSLRPDLTQVPPDLIVSSISRPEPVWRSDSRRSKIDNSLIATAWIESNEELKTAAEKSY